MPGTWRTNTALLSKRALIKGIFPADIDFTPEEADQFLDYVVEESVMDGNARIVRMNKQSRNVRAIGLGAGNVLHPAGNFDPTKYKKTLTHSKLTLSSKKARGCVIIYDDDIEDNIEGDAFVDHLMRMVAAKVANELEDGHYMGAKSPNAPTDSKDLRDMFDGFRHRLLTETHAVEGVATVLDARADFTFNDGYVVEQNSSAPYNWEFKFSKMFKALPSKFKKRGGGLGNFRLFMNDTFVQDYSDGIMDRGTAAGDAAILGKAPLQYGLVPIVACPLMPADLPVIVGTTPGDTTVDADSVADQKVLNVAATTNFLADQYIHIYKTGLEYKSEVHQIASVQTGVSLTLVDDLVWPHNVADAETVEEVTLDGGDCVLTQKENLIIGLQRDLKMETQRVPEDEATFFWFSLRSDVLIECVAAAVILINLKAR